jgi:hypothetical protein
MSNLPDENLVPLYTRFGNFLAYLERRAKDFMFLFAIAGIFIGLIFIVVSTRDWLKFGNWTDQSLYAHGWIFETDAIGARRLGNGFLSLHPIITLPIIATLMIFLLRVAATMIAVSMFSLFVSFIKLFKIKLNHKPLPPNDQSPTPDL